MATVEFDASRYPAEVTGRRRFHGLGRKTKGLERFFESVAIRRLGWDVALFRGERRPATGPIVPYRIVSPAWTLPRRHDRVFDTIVVGGWSRFGNSVEQLGNAIAYARRYGARRILVPPGHAIFRPPVTVDRLTFETGTIATLAARETALVGRFFLCPAGAHQPDVRTRYANASRCVHALLRPDVIEPDPRLAADDIVAYLRSDDVFTLSPPNPEYGQPPLAFYRGAIRDSGARRAWLVYENLANPAIAILADRLRSDGIEVITQSGTLIEDLRVLFSARRLVAGVSTLINVVMAVSAHLADLHLFGEQIDLRPPGAPITLHRTVDRSGRYVEALQRRNWRNSDEQRRLMLGYPAEQLALVREGPRALDHA